jgi:hypothetical protein
MFKNLTKRVVEDNLVGCKQKTDLVRIKILRNIGFFTKKEKCNRLICKLNIKREQD